MWLLQLNPELYLLQYTKQSAAFLCSYTQQNNAKGRYLMTTHNKIHEKMFCLYK